MDTNVEILVPNRAATKVKTALGPMRSTWFANTPSKRSAARLVVSWLADLESAESRSDLEALWAVASKVVGNVPMIFLSAGTRKTKCSEAVVQALLHWSRRMAEEPYVATDAAALRRIVLARQSGAEKELIASASLEDGKLVVWNCEPTRYEVPVAEIASLAGMKVAALARFEVSPSGSRISWREDDVDINLDTIRELADPDVRKAHEAKARQEAARYARAIRLFREERGLKQSDITGLTDRQMRRLEEGETVPQIETLRKLALAHGLSIDEYLKELAARSRGALPRFSKKRLRPVGR